MHLLQKNACGSIFTSAINPLPLDTGRKLNATFRRCSGRLLNVLCGRLLNVLYAFNLHSVFPGRMYLSQK